MASEDEGEGGGEMEWVLQESACGHLDKAVEHLKMAVDILALRRAHQDKALVSAAIDILESI